MIHLNNKAKQAQSKMIALELVQYPTDYGYENKLTILSSPIRSDNADHELVLIGN